MSDDARTDYERKAWYAWLVGMREVGPHPADRFAARDALGEIDRLRTELDRHRASIQHLLDHGSTELDRHRVAGDELDQLWTDAEIHGLTPGIEEQMRAASDRWRSVRGDAPAAVPVCHACGMGDSCPEHDVECAPDLVVGKAGVPIDAYDAIQLLAARPDHPSRLLAEKARAVADWWNDPPFGPFQRDQIEKVAPELVELLADLLGGGPGDVSDVRAAPDGER